MKIFHINFLDGDDHDPNEANLARVGQPAPSNAMALPSIEGREMFGAIVLHFASEVGPVTRRHPKAAEGNAAKTAKRALCGR